MTDTSGFADRDRPDLPAPCPDFWQPYDLGIDPLAALDPVYPTYPVVYPQIAYPQIAYPGAMGRYSRPEYPDVLYRPDPYLMAAPVMIRPRSNSMATAALISSLVAYPAMFFCFAGALVAPAAVALGIVALVQLKGRPYETGEGLAWSGIILGGLLTLMCVGLAAAWIALVTG